jgi:hypothetical protein
MSDKFFCGAWRGKYGVTLTQVKLTKRCFVPSVRSRDTTLKTNHQSITNLVLALQPANLARAAAPGAQQTHSVPEARHDAATHGRLGHLHHDVPRQ